ncbi:MAG: chorismate mutase [Bacillota bacterium]|nr:chorismate mutase [Bacillota bacterium]
MDLDKLRKEIDLIDDEIISLFIQRMEVVSKVAEYKKENGIKVTQQGREDEILKRVEKLSGEEMAPYSKELFNKLFELSKEYQNKQSKD